MSVKHIRVWIETFDIRVFPDRLWGKLPSVYPNDRHDARVNEENFPYPGQVPLILRVSLIRPEFDHGPKMMGTYLREALGFELAPLRALAAFGLHQQNLAGQLSVVASRTCWPDPVDGIMKVPCLNRGVLKLVPWELLPEEAPRAYLVRTTSPRIE